ncbi:CheR family methyltransferase [Phormidesmis priestleyi]
MTANHDLDFETLLEYLKQSRGFDFTGYKRSTLMRRVVKRMQSIDIESYTNYLDYLEVHPEEFNFLFNTLLINVTTFFRDRPTWDYLCSEIIPRILERREANQPIRVWSAGCASGEEAYTIAMALADTIDIDQFRERVKIYATDVDEEALNQARQAIYTLDHLEGVSSEQLTQYFEPTTDDRYVVREDLRRAVIFGRLDLVQDAPISKLDLLICRNTLMYFNAETQARILNRFHFALQNDGFIFLGKAEMLITRSREFTPIDLKSRIFTKVPKLNVRDPLRVTRRDRLLSIVSTDNDQAVNQIPIPLRLRETAFDRGTLATLVIDPEGCLVMANQAARMLFRLTPRDLDRPLQDLEVSYRPVELRSCIEQVYQTRQTMYVNNVTYPVTPSETVSLNVQLSPLLEGTDQVLGISVTFIDVSRQKRLQEELEHANQELEMAYEELQSTNEELETTNEELQSTNEELETTNEELQATNEELETMNEELQSTNEELQTVNDELQRSTENSNQSNVFLESILTSLKGGVVVVDRNLQVQVWNHKAEDLWGLRSAEAVGQNFLNLDIGLPVDRLVQSLRGCLLEHPSEGVKVILDAVNRRGKSIQCQISFTSLMGTDRQAQGVILLIEEQSSEADTQL